MQRNQSTRFPRQTGLFWWILALGLILLTPAKATEDDYRLGPGDAVRILVFQHPDLTLEARIPESGQLSYPLVGSIQAAGQSQTGLAQMLAQRLRQGRYLADPQVSVLITAHRSQQVSVLGQVARPGRYPIEVGGLRLSEVLALAGGIAPTGADSVVLMRREGAQRNRRVFDLNHLVGPADGVDDPVLRSEDLIFVERAPQYYIYGQVQRPGMYGVDRGLTVAQAIAKGGGLTLRGTDRGIRLQRRHADGRILLQEVRLEEAVLPDDLLIVRESVF
ncbi:MAG: Polysialic acid transport protein kpsD precursor [Pseudomonadota bacterium]|jgi:polysaccharide export outer membrane protein